MFGCRLNPFRLIHGFELEFNLIAFIQIRAFHLELHLVKVVLGNGCRIIKGTGDWTLEFNESTIPGIVGVTYNNSIGRCSDERMDRVRDAGCVYDLNTTFKLTVEFLCDRFKPRTPDGAPTPGPS